MKILLTLDNFFPDTQAGTEIYVLNLAKGLQKKGFYAIVAAASTKIKQKTTKYIYQGIEVYRFKVPIKETTAKLNGIGLPSGIDNFELLLDTIKPQILHIHTFSRTVNSFHLQLANNKKIKTVFTSHLSSIICIKGTFLYLDQQLCNGVFNRYKCLKCFIFSKIKNKTIATILSATINTLNTLTPLRYIKPSINIVNNKKNELQRLKKNADAIISLAEWIDNIYKKNKIPNTYIIKQAINTDNFAQQNITTQTNQTLNIAFIGRNVYTKGLHLLLDALQNISNNNYLLTIFALPGNIKKYNDQNIERIKTMKNCRYYESLSHSQIIKILQQTDLLCLPSSNEMAPLVILEAYSQKVPVLGSSHPAITEMIEDGITGFIFQNNNSNDLIQKLKYILDNPQILNKIKQNIQPVNSFNNVVDEHIKIYKKLL